MPRKLLGQGSEENPLDEVHSRSVHTEELNGVVHVQDDETLNEAVSRGTYPMKVVVPGGVTQFDSHLDPDGTLIIEGQGKDRTTLQSDGNDRFIAAFNGTADDSLILRGFTLDMNHVGTDGRVIYMAASRSQQYYDDIRVKNIDLSDNSDNNRGVIQQTSGRTARFVFRDCVFRMDTTQNLPDVKYQLLHCDAADYPDTIHVADDCRFVGIPTRTSSTDFILGFAVDFYDSMYIGGTWEDWGQYAVQAGPASAGGSLVVDVQATNIGNGDFINPRFGNEGDCVVRATVSSAHDEGDRAVIFGGGSSQAQFRNIGFDVTVSDTLVPVEIRGGENVHGRLRAYDVGTTGTPSGNYALELKDAADVIERFNVDVSVLNGSGRSINHAVLLRENNGNFGSGTHVLEGTAQGYDDGLVDDQTDSGTSLDTARLFG